MIDSNQSRFHLVMGPSDWGRFSVATSSSGPDPRTWPTLESVWKKPSHEQSVAWSERSQAVILAMRTMGFQASNHDAKPDLETRRASAMDGFGNIYRLSPQGDAILVANCGDRSESLFWPPPEVVVAPGKGGFGPVAAPAAKVSQKLSGLAVLPGHWLVAGSLEGDGALFLFDLVGGAVPLRLPLVARERIQPWDLAPTCDGGLLILDRAARKIWRLDRTLTFGLDRTPGASDPFVPLEVGGSSGAKSRAILDRFFTVDSAWDPISVEAMHDGSLLVLERNTKGWGRIERIRPGADPQTWSLEMFAKTVVYPSSSVRADFRLQGHDLAQLASKGDVVAIAVVSDDGNQAFRVELDTSGKDWVAKPSSQELPLRRYDGAALVRSSGEALYLSEGRWVNLVDLRRRRYAESARIASIVLDGREPGFPWNRVMLDGHIPPGAKVRVWARCADDATLLEAMPFRVQPDLVLRRSGSEIPWVERFENPSGGSGTWETLLQESRGRHLQIQLELAGQELHTPCIHALRIWMPRFSYVDRYLPAIYRENESSRDFLERFLANFEGMFTSLEDRIVQSKALFDVRTAPASALDWLADWIGLVFDPAMDPERRRVLLSHAPLLYAYRGTPQGILLALHIATSKCLRPQDFLLPASSRTERFGVRIAERFLSRGRSPLLSGETVADLEGAEDFVEVRSELAAEVQETWKRKWLALRPQQAATEVPALPTDLPATAKEQEIWRIVRASLEGNVARSLARFQAYLRRKYLRVERMNQAWGTRWERFDQVAPFLIAPAQGPSREDWLVFQGLVEPAAALAHRFRVLVPTKGPLDDLTEYDATLDHARRVCALEKPAHTTFDVQPYWAMFRVGQARLGFDSVLGEGSRSASLAPWLRIGSSQIGATRIPLEPPPADRIAIGNNSYRTRGG